MQLDTTTILFIIVGAATGVVGTILYVQNTGKVGAKKVVLLLRPRDKRGMEIPVVKETDRLLECAKVAGVTHRYLKNGPGWTFPNKTVFIAEEGIAYTATLIKGSPVNVPLPAALKSLWGEEKYKKLLPELREPVEHHKWGVVVDIRGKPEDAKLPSLSPEAVNDTRYEALLSFLIKTLKSKGKRDWMPILGGLVSGALIVYIAANMHWIRFA